MSGIQLNLDYGRSSHEDVGLRLPGNKKHKQFVQKRRFLERRGFLHSKQNQHQQWKKPRKGQKERSCSVKSQNNKSKVKQHFAGTTSVPKPSISQSTAQPASANTFSGALKSCSMAAQSKSPNFVPHSGNSMAALQNHIHIKDSLFSNPLKYVALDCEMVGTGPKGHCSEVARCSIVTYFGDVVYDKYILPTSRVTDFRTRWSGVRPKHLQGATPFVKARCEILQILSGMVVVGHSIQNDFKVLHYSHPAPLIRDISHIPLLNRKAGFPEQQVVSLKKLTKALLQRDIQTGRMGHSSVEDAKASMELYKHVEVEWEKELAVRRQAEVS